MVRIGTSRPPCANRPRDDRPTPGGPASAPRDRPGEKLPAGGICDSEHCPISSPLQEVRRSGSPLAETRPANAGTDHPGDPDTTRLEHRS